MKKIVILEHNRGRLANQLWNYMSIFAYCTERGFDLKNPSFFEYVRSFEMPTKSIVARLFSYNNIYKNPFVALFRPYKRYADLIRLLFPRQIVVDDNTHPFYLPPSVFRTEEDRQKIEGFEKSNDETLYLCGWMFRNPVGIEKYRKEIIDYFKPQKEIVLRVENLIATVRRAHKHIVGVHIRQGDYATFLGGAHFFDQKEVRKILDEYLSFKSLDPKDVGFILSSDGPIDEKVFKGLSTYRNIGAPVDDLFVLAKTDCIIGSNSTYGAFASYYGNIPLIVFERPVVDWDYYKNKQGFFENKKNTLVFY